LEFVDLLSASAPACDALELVSVFQAILPNEIWWNIHVLRMLHEVAARIAQESKSFAGDLDDAIEGAEFLGSRRWKLGTFTAFTAFATVFGPAVGPVSSVVSFVAVISISAIVAAASSVTVASVVAIISIASISAASIVSVIAKA
jgi:hypothetical protein